MKPTLKILLVVAGTILFNLIFWQEKVALNALLFDLFILVSVFYLYPSAFRLPVMKWLLLAHLVTLAAVLFHNTELSKIAFCCTLLLVVAFTQYVHRSVWYAAASVFMNYCMAPVSFFLDLQTLKGNKFNFKGVRKSIRFLVIPVLLLLIFFGLYNFANAVFKEMMDNFGLALQKYFGDFFSWFSWERTWFLVLGLFITCGLLLKSSIDYFSKADAFKLNTLSRKKNDLLAWKKSNWFDLLSIIMGRFASGVMALRNENTTGIISLALLNILLLFINVIDIIYVWFGFKYNDDLNLSAYVHEGTGLLIFSILLAMFLLLFFFRGNLNFYKRNKWLRVGAYAWLFQNAVLVVSVFFRDYYYIAHDGLAYKRIGVLVFLLMVLAGLSTIFIKIHLQKTTYYLLRVNAWFAIVLLVAGSCVHWDETIAKYNIGHKDKIALDVKFLLTLSDKTLPLLDKNRQIFSMKDSPSGTEGALLYRSGESYRDYFEKRKLNFEHEQQQYSWLSWNMADAYVKKQLAYKTQTSSVGKK